ncbi:MAG: 2-hydroxyacid dehydrogenase [Rhodospirillales bacterium]
MKPDVLIAVKLPPETIELLEENFTCHKLFESDDRDAFLKDIGETPTAMVTNGLNGYKRDLVEALPNLKMISVWGAGLQALDLDCAREKGIMVTNTPDDSKLAVSDLGMGLLLATARQIADGNAFINTGDWSNRPFGRNGIGVIGKTLGIVALGTIGRGVAKRAQGFDMNVLYYGPNKKDDVDYKYYTDVKAMAADSDFLMLCCPETPDTVGLITADVLKALGPDGILINIARGAVVDEPALIKALQDGVIWGAGLDVFADEPNVPKELRELDNVVCVPHVGTSTLDIRRIRKEKCVENLKLFFAGKDVLSPVV